MLSLVVIFEHVSMNVSLFSFFFVVVVFVSLPGREWKRKWSDWVKGMILPWCAFHTRILAKTYLKRRTCV